MNADVQKRKVKRDRNNFITIILSRIMTAKLFHQRVALSITSKRVLNYIHCKFYIRRRYNDLYLYIRIQGNFRNIRECHTFIEDLYNITPCAKIEGSQGHYKGLVIPLTDNVINYDLINFLKLLSLLAHPQDFYRNITKVYYSYYNYQDTSSIPIHLRFTKSLINNLKNEDLKQLLTTGVQCFHA